MAIDIQDQQVTGQWQNIVEIMARIMHVPSAIITRVMPPYIEVFRASRNPENPYKQGQCVELAGHYCEAVINSGQRMKLPNALKDPKWAKAPEIDYNIISYLGYPISWPDGDVFGTICVLDNKENSYSEDYEQLLSQFQAVVETHLQLIFQNSELEKRMQEVRFLRGIIPICCHCKNVRNDEGYWQKVESYIRDHSGASFSHGLCPECEEKLYQEI